MKKKLLIYGNDIRALVIESYNTGQYTIKELSEVFNVANQTVSNWVNKYYGKGEQNQYGLKSKV